MSESRHLSPYKKRICSVLVFSSASALFAQSFSAIDPSVDLENRMNEYLDKARSYMDGAKAFINQNDANTAEAKKVMDFYKNNAQLAFAQPLEKASNQFRYQLNNYAAAVLDALNKSGALDSKNKDYSRCVSQNSVSPADDLARSVALIQNSLFAGNSWMKDFKARQPRINGLSTPLLSPTYLGRLKTCCDDDAPADKKSLCEKFSKISSPVPLLVDQLLPPPTDLNDPADNFKDREVLFALIGNSAFRKDYQKALSSELKEGDDSTLYFLNQVQQSCLKAQKDEALKKEVTNAIGKFAKCQLAPFLTTMYADTGFQKMTLGIAAAPIKTPQADLTCDPNEIAAWDAARPTDPNVIAQRWGIPQLRDPKWITDLRNLPPASAPFPIMAGPFGSATNPYVPMGLENSILGTNAQNASGPFVSTALRGSVFVPTTFPIVVNPVRRVVAASAGRGAYTGQALVSGARNVASQISSGVQAQNNAVTLRMGAQSVRGLAQSMATNNAANTATQRRSLAAQDAAQARNLVVSAATTIASRTSTSGLLNNINRGGASTTTLPTNNSSSNTSGFTSQLESYYRYYMDNANTAYNAANVIRQQIQDLIRQRDTMIDNMTASMYDKPPRDQSRQVANARNAAMDMDRQLGALKLQYDTDLAQGNQQMGYYQRVAMFGPAFGNVQMGPGGAPTFNITPGSTTPSSGPSLPGSGRTPTQGAFFKTLFEWGFATAWADALSLASTSKWGAYRTEKEWRAGLSRFVKELQTELAQQNKEIKKIRDRMAQTYIQHQSSISEKTVRDSNTETLVAMQMYAESINLESTHLLRRAKNHEILNSKSDQGTLKIIEDAQKESNLALDALDQINFQYRDSYPKSYEDNPEIWWSMLNEAILF